MKLLIMGNNGHLGGFAVHYTTLVQYLALEPIELFCINVNDKEEKIFNNNKVKEIVVPYQPVTLIQKANKIYRLYKAVQQARKFKPDVYVAAGLGLGYTMIASKLPSSVFKVFEEVHFEAKADKLRLKMIQEFNAVATQTKGMIPQFKLNVSDVKPVYFLPCFSKEYDVSDYKQIPAITQTIRVAYFGRLAWNKGLREFLKATVSVFKEYSSVKFDIFGGGPEKNSIHEEINALNLTSQVTLKGFYSDDEFPELIGSYHAVILPSIATEGLPLILIEAMRFGRPVFTTTTGAMPEVGEVNKNGMMVSEKDKPSMETNFKIFLENLQENKFDADYINNIYQSNFSNEAFKNIWLEMLKNPKSYFLQNESQLP